MVYTGERRKGSVIFIEDYQSEVGGARGGRVTAEAVREEGFSCEIEAPESFL